MRTVEVGGEGEETQEEAPEAPFVLVERLNDRYRREKERTNTTDRKGGASTFRND